MKPLLIGLAGRAGAGKDTVGGMLVAAEELNGRFDSGPWKLISFAAPIKKICGEIFNFSDRQLHGDRKNSPDPRYQRADGTFLTPREAMQRCGTELGRACYPLIWTELALRNAQALIAAGSSVAITDVRFITEAKAIRDAGGQVWRIWRPSADVVVATHISETEMNTPEFKELTTAHIYNDGSLENLRALVAKALTL